MAEAAAVSEICSTVGTDEAAASRALAVYGGDVHKAISALLAADLPKDSADILHYNEKLARLEGSILSWEDTFSFDALGWLVLPVTLSTDQLAKLRATDGSAGVALIGEFLNGYSRSCAELATVLMALPAVLATEPSVMRDSIDHNDPWLFGDMLAGLEVPAHVLGADPDFLLSLTQCGRYRVLVVRFRASAGKTYLSRVVFKVRGALGE